MEQEIKVKVELTDGFRERLTEACLQELSRRRKREHNLPKYEKPERGVACG
ncbi:MAG: hypothetical protein LUC83_09945 [Clostridiales bacterium]|nr:hypothetical protein [Clostridiales bacterium]